MKISTANSINRVQGLIWLFHKPSFFFEACVINWQEVLPSSVKNSEKKQIWSKHIKYSIKYLAGKIYLEER